MKASTIRLDYGFFADAATEIEATGQFSVLKGGVDFVQCSQFPATLPSIALVARLSIDPRERGKWLPVDIGIFNSAGKPITEKLQLPIFAKPNVLGNNLWCLWTLVVKFEFVEFHEPGTHQARIMRVEGDERIVGEIPIHVIPLARL